MSRADENKAGLESTQSEGREQFYSDAKKPPGQKIVKRHIWVKVLDITPRRMRQSFVLCCLENMLEEKNRSDRTMFTWTRENRLLTAQ